MKKLYDIVYLTNTPSFYKINLCNSISKRRSVLLVLYGYGSEAVNIQLKSPEHYEFDYVFLSSGDSAKRNKLKTLWNLIRLMIRIKCKIILYPGWFVPEYNLFSIFSSKKKNVVVCESSSIESHFYGFKGFVKRLIINRMSIALPSGKLHSDIFKNIKFKGKLIETGGVGIFNKSDRNSLKHDPHYPMRYLYVGRLIDIKNVDFLIREFNESGKLLTIVGEGEMKEYLKSIALSNISFKGFICNNELSGIYKEHDVFILPSKSEPWGLVVDEAIYWGLPVIVSDKVGCYIDLVELPKTGCVFKLDDQYSFRNAMQEIETNYQYYKQNVDKVDFEVRDENQVNAYTQLIN